MRERKLKQLKSRRKHARRRFIILFAAIILIFGIGICSFIVNAQFGGKQTMYKYYTDIRVSKGETLWEIAQKYMTEEYDSIYSYIDEVCSINSISDNNSIYYGQKLMIPYYSDEYK